MKSPGEWCRPLAPSAVAAPALVLLLLCHQAVAGSRKFPGSPDRERKLFKREFDSNESGVPPPPPDVFPRFASADSQEAEEDAIQISNHFNYKSVSFADDCGGDYEIATDKAILFYSRHDNKSFECNTTFRAQTPGQKVHVFCPHILLRFNCFFEELYVYTETSKQTKEERLCRTSTTLTKTGDVVRFLYLPRVTLFSSGYVCLVGVSLDSTAAGSSAAQQQDDLNDAKLKCGVSVATSTRHSTMRIVGGIPVIEFEFPWMVLILMRLSGYDSEVRCGASLIGPRLLVTAAHCVDFDIEYIKVGLGLLNYTDTSTGTVWMKTSNFTKHPEYNSYTIVNDVALVFLNESVPLTDRIRPICIPKDDADFAYFEATATGWGNTAYEGKSSLTLQKVDLNISTNAKCESSWKTHIDQSMKIEPTQLCTTGDGKDTCTGDSGGPLFVLVNDQAYLVGITSYGYKCAVPDMYAVYTRVSKFTGWMSKYMNVDDKFAEVAHDRSRRKTITL